MEPYDLHKQCNGCGTPFSISHAIWCNKFGLVTVRHEEIVHELANLAATVWLYSAVRLDPMIFSSRCAAGNITNTRDNAATYQKVPVYQDLNPNCKYTLWETEVSPF